MGKRRFLFRSLIGITPEFTAADKAISLSLFGYRIAWFIVFAIVTIWNIPQAWRWPERWWVNFWHVTCIWLPLIIAVVMVFWFTWGGLKDIRELFIRLGKIERNPMDDGTVAGHENLDEAAMPAPVAKTPSAPAPASALH